MKKIKLNKNQVALVDDADYSKLSLYNWRLHRIKNKFYAVRSEKGVLILMHREILGVSGNEMVDHKDGDGLNNQRGNIRTCTYAQNNANKALQKNSASGFKGVGKTNTGWRARIYKDGVFELNKSFKTIKEAAKAYDEKAKELFGEFAKLNFPNE